MPLERLNITLLTGEQLTVTPNLGHQLQFKDWVRKNPQNGDAKENAIMFNPFKAWAAAHDAGLFPGTWAEFLTSVNHVESAEPDPADDPDGLEVDGVGKDTPTEPSTTY